MRSIPLLNLKFSLRRTPKAKSKHTLNHITKLLAHSGSERTWVRTQKWTSVSSNDMLDHFEQPFYWVRAENLVKISKQHQTSNWRPQRYRGTGTRKKSSSKMSPTLEYFSLIAAFANADLAEEERQHSGIITEELQAPKVEFRTHHWEGFW